MKSASHRSMPNALVGLAAIFLVVLAVRPLGLIADLHPLEAYTDTGMHSFVPYDIESETDREHFRYSGRTRTFTKYMVVYKSDDESEYKWTDKQKYSSHSDAEEVVLRAAPVDKKVFTVADGSYVVDDADHTPADYIKHTIVTNGAISLLPLDSYSSFYGHGLSATSSHPTHPSGQPSGSSKASPHHS